MKMYWSLREALPLIAADVIQRGEKTSPRGQATREILGYVFAIQDATDALPTMIGRQASVPMAAMEAIQLVGGFSDPVHLRQINPTMERFFNMPEADPETWTQHGAYGPRVREPMRRVLSKLREDPDSRQALTTVWSPSHDYQETPDVPCTVDLQFFIRDDRLVAITHMRSNDVYWGLTYDVFQFTQLQRALAGALELEVGPYIHMAGSMHVYLRDLVALDKLTPSLRDTHDNPPPLVDYPVGDFSEVQVRCRSIAAAAFMRSEDLLPSSLTAGERWYYGMLQHRSKRLVPEIEEVCDEEVGT